MPIRSRLDGSHPRNSVVTVRYSQRYPDVGMAPVSNLDLSMNGVWLSAKTAVQSSNRLPSWIVFAAAPSLENYLGSVLNFDPSDGKLSWGGTLYERRADIIATPVPLCFQPGKPPPGFLPGSWIESPQSQIKYGTASEYELWAENACYAEMTVHSCFFLNDTARASRIAKRIWQPHKCALLPFDSYSFLKKLHGRHLYFVGDSISTQMFASLLCLLRGDEKNKHLHWVDTTSSWNRRENCPAGAMHCYFGGESQHSSNCVEFSFSVTICLMNNLNFDALPSRSVVLVNFGLHFFPSNEADSAFFSLVDSIVSSSKDDEVRQKHIHVVWRQVSLQHFDSADCSYENSVSKRCSDRSCDYSSSSRAKRDKLGAQMLQKGGVDVLWIQGYENTSQANVRILRRTDTPSSVDDCTHWCLPGMPDHWNRLFFNYIISRQL